MEPVRYKAGINGVSPQRNRHTFEQQDTCFIAVSLESPNFEYPRFYSIVEWVSRRYSKFQIFVADNIHRITLELRDGLPTGGAQRLALELGQQFIKDNACALERCCPHAAYEFVLCSKIQQTDAYLRHYAAMRTYFEKQPAFKRSVEDFAEHYHRKKSITIDPAHKTYCIKRSCDYFLEEFAVMSCLAQKGNKVLVYPGSFGTLNEISDGAFPGLCAALEQITVVSLRFKRRGHVERAGT